ncbi:hypothetical protein Tco_1176437 [Tanacetum coccineum]
MVKMVPHEAFACSCAEGDVVLRQSYKPKSYETRLRQLMSSPGAPSAGPSTPPSYSSGPSTPPSYSSGPSTPPNYSPGSSRNAECSNCKHLRGKISVLKATMDMHMHPEQHTVNSAALFHEVLNEMEKLDLEYHNGPLLSGNISLNLVWYGNFKPSQKAIISDFITSLSSASHQKPSVVTWWKTSKKYHNKLSKPVSLSTKLGKQVSDPKYSFGKSLSDNHLVKLASKVASPNAVTVVLTANDVAVTRFCSGQIGTTVLGTLAGMGGVIPTAEGVQRRTIPWEGDEQEEGDKEKNAIFISGTEAGKISEEIQNVEKRRIIILDVPTVGGPLMFVDMAGSENIEQAGTYLLTKNMYSAYDGSTVLPSPYISSEFSFL